MSIIGGSLVTTSFLTFWLQLCAIYDKVCMNVWRLEALGIGAEQYGSFLIPMIMAKFPLDVRLQITRITTRDVWKIEELL